ncbi:MAG: hypothetical protein VX780_00310, partial [Pseudomonadota bacterium]|nr:hypothetical protein [Pseudomonadota bacterium]
LPIDTPWFDLHLRDTGLDPSSATILANALRYFDASSKTFIKSLSLSYNPNLGDRGASIIAKSLRKNLSELGMVGCEIGDWGGEVIFQWVEGASNLQMICLGHNPSSERLKAQFNRLARQRLNTLFVT